LVRPRPMPCSHVFLRTPPSSRPFLFFPFLPALDWPFVSVSLLYVSRLFLLVHDTHLTLFLVTTLLPPKTMFSFLGCLLGLSASYWSVRPSAKFFALPFEGSISLCSRPPAFSFSPYPGSSFRPASPLSAPDLWGLFFPPCVPTFPPIPS